jgi:hypothetical protein
MTNNINRNEYFDLNDIPVPILIRYTKCAYCSKSTPKTPTFLCTECIVKRNAALIIQEFTRIHLIKKRINRPKRLSITSESICISPILHHIIFMFM